MYWFVTAEFQEEIDNGRIRKVRELTLVAGATDKEARDKAYEWFQQDTRPFRIVKVDISKVVAVID